ncbi:hypothetical protein CBR_g8365 [Chara braunii]|uniref:Uncharacterized protein n=1 Tax=Chara braunii TaxID=69332 RepID=A0A388KLY9_CHABU|nr:hypothetical protein CBR_g8365 [Chara braunii]|eukprot:GBG71066.1 hypothetical protein CBR_g8365 [Chara braunii]
MFDTKAVPNMNAMNPFTEECTLRTNPVQAFPQELFFLLRTTQLLRGLTAGMAVEWSIVDNWCPLAKQVLLQG